MEPGVFSPVIALVLQEWLFGFDAEATVEQRAFDVLHPLGSDEML
jgi:hypothetical protein